MIQGAGVTSTFKEVKETVWLVAYWPDAFAGNVACTASTSGLQRSPTPDCGRSADPAGWRCYSSICSYITDTGLESLKGRNKLHTFSRSNTQVTVLDHLISLLRTITTQQHVVMPYSNSLYGHSHDCSMRVIEEPIF